MDETSSSKGEIEVLEHAPEVLNREQKGREEVRVAVASSYKVCSKCSKQIKRKRFAEHFSICCPTKTCSEIFEEKTCGAKYETVKQHIKHCK